MPTINPHLWDINNILNEKSFVGELLQSLMGYNGDPSLEEVVAYVGYWVFALLGIHWLIERSLARGLGRGNP